ncbi:MAG: molybdopterin cofactor-binding domain-containing protein [Acetobacteraceae bacterium]
MGHDQQPALSRRGFVLASLSVAGGLAIGIRPGLGADAGAEIGPWLVIDPDETITIRVARSEMGQGIWTGLPMIVAEELECDWATVRAEYASANRNLTQHVYGRMATGGSQSVRSTHTMLQQAGASARVRLIGAAARRWGVAEADCVARDGAVTHSPTGRRLSFGALAGDAASFTPTREPAIKSPDQFRLCGTSLPRLDSLAKSTGQATFGIDVRLPGMVYAAVTLCPVIGGTVTSYDAAAVLRRRGVQAVVPVPGGLAVVADRFWRAQQAAAALPVTWDLGPGAGTSSEQFRADYRAALDGPLVIARDDGDARAVLAAGKTIEATYDVPYLAHAPMEPLNCTAHVQPGRVDVWLGTQSPEMALQLAARAAWVPPERVFVHTCFLGGGFGRRSMNDELIQAVTVAKAVGKPVKLIWTRETDMRHNRYRPMAALRCRGALGAGGSLEALHIQTAVGSIMHSLGWGRGSLEPMAVSGLVDQAYAAKTMLVEATLKNTEVPAMFWRSVGYSQNTFVMESFIDELAHAAGEDPYRFRRKLLAGQPEWLRVLDTAAERSGWGTPLPGGQGRGIAIHISHDTIVAQVAEVAVSTAGKVRVQRVVSAVDPGWVINPRLIEMQIEGGIIYGLTAALYGAITLKDGQVQQGNFDTYRMMLMADSPRFETHIIPSHGKRWGGIGEPGVPPAAPAVANAIFAITGTRIRRLPISDTDLTSRT